EVLKSFDVDTVFDVNAIVSHVLFAILFDEVRYVQSDADLQALERMAKGKTDLVLGYVQMLGTQEHRALMETVFVYGAKYQFILTTGGPILEHLGASSHSSGAWFLHCRVHRGFMTLMTSDRCPLTPMRKPLSTLGLYSFLQLMEAPLSEVYEDPSSVQPPQPPHLQTPQLFLFSRPSTEHLDLDTATTLAWRLRGLALLVIFTHVCVIRHLEEDEEEEGEEEEDEDEETLDVLDDEIEESVYRTRGHLLNMDSITQLTTDSFHTAVAENSLTVALFYLKWDAVSMAFLSSFIEVAERLEGKHDHAMAVVDCGEWTDLCAAQPVSSQPTPFQPITAFPTVLLLRPQESPQRYRGMLGSEALHRIPVFTEAAKSLRGQALTGLLTDKLPELTVENLPSFLSLGKALLLLFVGEEEDEWGRRENEAVVEEIRGVVESEGSRTERYLACWIHLGHTPAGISVLESYLGTLPPLPALVLTHLPSRGEIYHFPSNTPIVAHSVLQWLQRIEEGSEPAAGMIEEDRWTPVVPFYDFLSAMDQEVPGYAQQRTSKSKEKKGEEEEEDKEERRRRRSRDGGIESGSRRVERDSSSNPSTPPLHSEL
uniref:Thioredoxin domain containing 16 n=1 Tax=Myripristis murdjan TaxID=586833 RepID=A0A667X906_9TELE